MKIDVSTQARSRTLCQKGFACASRNRETLCKVKALLAGEALMIECAEELLCRYQESFGSWAICTCPTRKEIYSVFGV
ncbi:MAG: hypothetical protein M0042_04285 [Nitrospiraceae bacterium]|nr:hypothetical protein [Nitrospiraceae bacterium]